MGSKRSASVAGAMADALVSRRSTLDLLAALRGLWARTDRWLVGILIVALALRVLWVASIQPDPRDGRFDDTVWYYNTARHLALGDGYVVPGDAFCKLGNGIGCDERPPTALWAPGYSLVLSALLRLPGDGVAAARGLNVAAGLSLVLGVYYLGWRLWDRRAGLLGAAIVALFPSHVFFSSLVLTETLFTAMAVGLLCLALAWTLEGEVSARRLFALGLAAGALAMVRPEGIVFAGVIVLTWLAVYRSWLRVAKYTGLLLLGIAVLFVPWTIRNAIQLKAPIVGTTGFGQVLLQAHHPAADGRPEFWIVVQLTARFAGVPRPEREARINNAGIRDSVTYALHHPGRELSLVPQRLAAFYQGDRGAIGWNRIGGSVGRVALGRAWADRWGLLSDVYYYAVLGAAVLGLPFWVRRVQARHLLVLGPLAVYTAMWAFLFVGEARYHFPLSPLFALLAAAGLSAFAGGWGNLRRVPEST